jgi:DNA recombination protein RmuC
MEELNPLALIDLAATGILALAVAFLGWRIVRLTSGNKENAVKDAFRLEADRIERVFKDETRIMRGEAESRGQALRQEVATTIQGFGDSIHNRVKALGTESEERFTRFGQSQEQRSKDLNELVSNHLTAIKQELEKQLSTFRTDNANAAEAQKTALKEMSADISQKVGTLTESNEKKQEALRVTVEGRLDKLRNENTQKLEEMRQTVDEKLQGTLDKRLGESFKVVSDRLEQVHKGLGEMQTLATGVGDLKRALTNVKLRGGWAEVQLGALLEQMLTPDQYGKNVKIKPNSLEIVEFAIRLPGQNDNGSDVLLPIDAKFPHEDFERLMEAMEKADASAVELAGKQIEARIKTEAKRICDKYVDPPTTTDFAILFLPTEGLFAEVIRRPGLVIELQQKHRVMVTGPTTLGALLNSLQMGFRTLAIQKRSSEVWQVLGEAKAEFTKYGDVWDKVKRQLHTVSNTVDEAGRRTRAVQRKLRDVEALEISGDKPDLITLDDEPELSETEPASD